MRFILALAVVTFTVTACSTTGTTATASFNGKAAVTTTTAATADPQATLSDAITAWYEGGGQDRMSDVSQDLGAVGTAAGAKDIPGLGDACTSLQTAVESAQAYAPIPDAETQSHWAAALASYARAATDCLASVDTLSADLVNQMSDELDTGNTDLAAATARIKQISGD